MTTNINLIKNDFEHFVNNYCIKREYSGDAARINLTNIQKEIFKSFQNKNVLNVCSRMSGKTHLISLFSIWKSMFSNENITIISQNPKQLFQNIKEIIEFFPENFPKFYINKFEIKFQNSSIKILNSYDKLYGINSDILIFDEIKDSIENQLNQTFAKNIFILTSISESNKNSIQNLINRNFQINKYPWNLIETKDENWENYMIQNVGIKYFKQQFECEII